VKVRVRFFAVAREIAGVALVDVDAPEGTTVSALVRLLGERCGRRLLDAVGAAGTRVALNQELTEGDPAIHDGDEVAFLPRVTGG
jgi:molybdopterin synthase sulfur carrier subunit